MNAAGQLDRLEARIEALQHHPRRGAHYPREPWASAGVRMMPVDNYVVFYQVFEDAQTVSVLRVLYGGRDLDTQLDMTDLGNR